MKWIIEWVSMDWIEVAVSVGRWRLRRCSRPDPPLRRCRRSTPWAPSGRLRRRRRQRIRLPPPVVAKYSTDIITEKKNTRPVPLAPPTFRFHPIGRNFASISFPFIFFLSFSLSLFYRWSFAVENHFHCCHIQHQDPFFFFLSPLFRVRAFLLPVWLKFNSNWIVKRIGGSDINRNEIHQPQPETDPKWIDPSVWIEEANRRIGMRNREGRERGEGERGGRKSDGYLIGTADGMHGIRAGIGGTGVGAAWAAVRLGSHHSDAVDFAAARSVHRQHRVAMLSAALLSALLSAALLSAALLSAWSALLMGLSSINKLTNESISNLYIIFVIFLHFNS